MRFNINHPATMQDLEETDYPAVFLRIEGPFEGREGDYIKWIFRIHKEGEVFDVSGITSAKFSTHPKCKSMQWAKAIDSSLDPSLGSWDSAHFRDVPCIISIEAVVGNTTDFPSVTDVQPAIK